MAINIKTVQSFVKASGVKSILQTKLSVLKEINPSKLKFDTSDFAYHGSPFNFNFFDAAMIGSGEGMAKRGRGLYLSKTKRIAPYYANLRCKDAPLGFGANKVLENADPQIYTISGIRNLNLKSVTELEAKSISKSQKIFEKTNPNIDGLLVNNEICVFPKSIDKINIFSKKPLEEFVTTNKDFPFRTWTTDKFRVERLGLPDHHLSKF